MAQQKNSKKRSADEMLASSKSSQKKKQQQQQQKQPAAAAAAAAADADADSDVDMANAEEDIEDVIGGNTDFYFDDDDDAADAGDGDAATGDRAASAKKRAKTTAASAGDASKAAAAADGDDEELVVTDVDAKEVEYRVDENDATKSTAQVGLEAPENAALFAKCLRDILAAPVTATPAGAGADGDAPESTDPRDVVLKLAQGSVKRRLDLLNKELQKENKERRQRFERLLFERQNHVKPHIDTLEKERQLKKLGKSGLVQLLNAVMVNKRKKKEQTKQVEENPYAILKSYRFNLHH